MTDKIVYEKGSLVYLTPRAVSARQLEYNKKRSDINYWIVMGTDREGFYKLRSIPDQNGVYEIIEAYQIDLILMLSHNYGRCGTYKI